MALPKVLPPAWLNCPLKIATATPVNRNGNLDFPLILGKIVADFEEMIEIDTVDSVKLYPKNAVAYLVRDKSVLSLS